MAERRQDRTLVRDRAVLVDLLCAQTETIPQHTDRAVAEASLAAQPLRQRCVIGRERAREGTYRVVAIGRATALELHLQQAVERHHAIVMSGARRLQSS